METELVGPTPSPVVVTAELARCFIINVIDLNARYIKCNVPIIMPSLHYAHR
jgi:hypothetical protein